MLGWFCLTLRPGLDAVQKAEVVLLPEHFCGRVPGKPPRNERLSSFVKYLRELPREDQERHLTGMCELNLYSSVS